MYQIYIWNIWKKIVKTPTKCQEENKICNCSTFYYIFYSIFEHTHVFLNANSFNYISHQAWWRLPTDQLSLFAWPNNKWAFCAAIVRRMLGKKIRELPKSLTYEYVVSTFATLPQQTIFNCALIIFISHSELYSRSEYIFDIFIQILNLLFS